MSVAKPTSGALTVSNGPGIMENIVHVGNNLELSVVAGLYTVEQNLISIKTSINGLNVDVSSFAQLWWHSMMSGH